MHVVNISILKKVFLYRAEHKQHYESCSGCPEQM